VQALALAGYEEAAEALRRSGEEGLRVRPRGGGTKLGWGTPAPEPDVELSTERLDRVLEHNAGDLTAIVQAGVPLARAQAVFAEAGQMLALDPPLGAGEGATVGGVVAAGDTGPLRHRYGGPRDLVIGIRVALSDGTVARSGGQVIKNVAGYDLAKLFAGSFGTLGLVLEVALRLHPRPERRATVVGRTSDPDALACGAAALAHASLELESLDVAWRDGAGEVLARFAGAAGPGQAGAARGLLERAGLDGELVDDDDRLWAAQRAGQRSEGGAVLRVSGLQGQLATALGTADRLGAGLVGRAALGLSWITLPAADAAAVEELRRALAPSPCVLLDAPAELRERVDVWNAGDSAPLELMRRLKARFDVHGVCNPGVFVGGI
jgi:glycolate oxidase FAD binding subunit